MSYALITILSIAFIRHDFGCSAGCNTIINIVALHVGAIGVFIGYRWFKE